MTQVSGIVADAQEPPIKRGGKAERGQSAELKRTNNASCSAGANFVILEGMERAPVPTLEQLRRGTPWCWVVCEYRLHRTPVAFVPLIIRWGPNASSDLLCRSARCSSKCGRKDAVLQHPSWAGMDLEWEPFPSGFPRDP
jgi:hypothetical protein